VGAVTAPGEPYGVNVGRFRDDHPDRILAGASGGSGYRARPREGTGPWVSALTLDELHARLAEEDAADPDGVSDADKP